MSLPIHHRRAVQVLVVHLAVLTLGSWAHELLGRLLLLLTLADCGLLLWTVAAHSAGRAGTDAGEQR